MTLTREQRPYLKGILDIYTLPNGQQVFTLASLSSVLGVPTATIEGRYNRTNAKVHKIDIADGPGRPIRGFPLELLETIVAAFTKRGATFTRKEMHVLPEPAPGTAQFVMYKGDRYYTPESLANYYGVSISTVRSRIKASGLQPRLVPISQPKQGGRPRVAFHECALPDVHLAIQHQITFETIEAADLARKVADSFPTDIPAPRPYEPAEPTTPVNTVNPIVSKAPVVTREGVELGRELNAWLESLNIQPAQVEPIVYPTRGYSPPQWQAVTSEQEWLALRDDDLRKLVVSRFEPDYDRIYEVIAPRLNGVGEALGLSTTADELIAFVKEQRERVRDALRPYEDAVARAMERAFGDEPVENIEPLEAFYKAALATAPLFVAQRPNLDSIASRSKMRTVWANMRKVRSDTEAYARMKASTLYRDAFARFKQILVEEIEVVEGEHHIGARISDDGQNIIAPSLDNR